MQEIIKKAIDGGWKPFQKSQFLHLQNPERPMSSYSVQILDQFSLDPNFWKCLGKACGWGDYAPYNTPLSEIKLNSWRWFGIEFHIRNLDGGFDKAIDWLKTQI